MYSSRISTIRPIGPVIRNIPISTSEFFEIKVGEDDQNVRLDSFLAAKCASVSRAKIQRSIANGHAKVDGIARKPSFKVATGQLIQFQVPPPASEAPIPENIPLDIVYEDDFLIGIDKPSRMVVHPAKGHWSGTLTAALSYHFHQLSSVGGPARPGIVHRLDRDTSGIMIVAKTDQAHQLLSQQFEQRTVRKVYLAIVSPPPDRDRDIIDQPIGVHPYQREKMAIRANHKTSRNAVSQYEVVERIGRFAIVRVMPKTGRTHQIRVHMNHVGSSVVADKLYSGHSRLTQMDIERSLPNEILLDRQALHAQEIEFKHPFSGKSLQLQASLPCDMANCWEFIKNRH